MKWFVYFGDVATTAIASAGAAVCLCGIISIFVGEDVAPELIMITSAAAAVAGGLASAITDFPSGAKRYRVK